MARTIHTGPQAGDVARVVTGDQEIALKILGQYRRINNLDDHRFDFRGANLHRAAPVATNNLLAGHHARQQLTDTRAVALDKRFTPIAKCEAPGIAATGGAAMRVQLATQRAQPPRTMLIKLANTPRRLHARKTVQPLAEKQFTAGTPREGVDILVRVACPEPGEDYPTFIRLAVTVGIANMDEVAAVANVRAAMAEGKTGGHVKAVDVGGNLVRPAVTLGVLQNEQLVVGLRARLELRIGPRAEHPQPPAPVPAHTNRIGDTHRFVGKKIYLQALVHCERSQLCLYRVIFLRLGHREWILRLKQARCQCKGQ